VAILWEELGLLEEEKSASRRELEWAFPLKMGWNEASGGKRNVGEKASSSKLVPGGLTENEKKKVLCSGPKKAQACELEGSGGESRRLGETTNVDG